MNDKTSDELIASIPYENGRSIEYYSDRVVFNRNEILYEDITGYGYSLTSYTQSVYLIPTHNSKTVTLSISVGNDNNPVKFSKTVTMPMSFHSKEQEDLSIIFSEIIKITDAILSQSVFNKLHHKILAGEPVNICGLTVEEDSIRRKGMFKEKELEQYGRTYTKAGQVIVEDGNGKQFFSTPLGNINAPILGYLLDAYFKD